MKKLTVIFIAIFGMTFAFTSVNAQNTATENTAAGATIVSTITLTEVQDLQFGEIVKNAAGGTVVIQAASDPARDLDGLTNLPGDVHRAAQFTVNGDDNFSFKIEKDATVTLTGPTGTGTDNLVITTSLSGSASGVTTTSGAYTFYIGGSMPVASDQIAGDYTGAFDVTVTYE